MKLTIFLLIVTLIQVSAKGFSQKITLNAENATLENVLQSIKKQSGYVFVYKDGDVQGKTVNVQIKDASIEETLSACLQNTQLTFNILNKNVVISASEKTVFEKIKDALALSYKIKGHVTDSLGNPLVGVTVQLNGNQPMTIAAITDEFGAFQFSKIPSGSYQMRFSYIGYQTIEKAVTITDQDININLNMRTEIRQLQAISVVNTGYQQISAERMTGAFDNIKKSQIDKPTTNIAERLIGQTAGMQVKLDVDGNPTIELRGQTSLNVQGIQGANTPLIVVDGFPLTVATSNPFTTINPNDVESITVLKDAAAASIWGAKSANGVIVITTKKGNRNTPLKIDFSAFTKFSAKQNVEQLTGLASSAQTVDYEQQAFNKWGGYINSGAFYDNYRTTQATTLLDENNLGYLSNAQLAAGLAQLKTQNNQGQISDYLLSHPLTTQYNLSLSGGSQRMSNLVSMMAQTDQSNLTGNNDRKYALNYRTNANVFKWLDFDLSGTFGYTKTNNNSVGLYNIQQLSPYDMLKNPDGSLTDIYQYYEPSMLRLVPLSKFPYPFNYNPIQEMNNTFNTTVNKNIRIQAGLTFKILPGLTFNSRIQYENQDQFDKSYQNDQTFAVRSLVNTSSTWDQTLTGSVTPNLPLGGILNQSLNTVESYIFRNQANFSRTFSEKHEINVVAGTEISSTVSQSTGNPTTYGYNDQTLSVGGFPNGVTGTTDWNGYTNNFSYLSSYLYRTQRFYSLFANASYTYDSKYTVSGSYRTDASNLIASEPKYRYSPFYSAGLGYEISKEDFMKSIGWLDRLNLRATYGRTGNVNPSTSPFTLITQQPVDRYTNDPIAVISTFGNPELTWEKTQTTDLGFDFSVLKNKLYGKVDVYNKNGKDLLASIALPSYDGTSFALFNNAALKNKGIEVTLGTSLPLKGNDIIWNGNFTASYNKSTITTLLNSTYNAGLLVQGGSGAYSQGYDPNTAWAYQYAGVVNGEPMIKGPNGTLLPLGSYLSSDGRGYLENMGTRDPRYILGFTNSFKIYDFNVSFIIIAKLGAVFQGQYFNYPQSGFVTLPNAQLANVINGNPNKIVTLPTNPNDYSYGQWISTDRFLNYTFLNASLARLQEANISYNLPKRWINKISINNAQLILQGNNLYTWLANKTGQDPEYPIGTIKPKPQYTLGIKFQL